MAWTVQHEVTAAYYGTSGVEYPPGHRFATEAEVPPTCRTRPVPVQVPDPPAPKETVSEVKAGAGSAQGKGASSGSRG